jgi:cell wall-associated NlpC family hydrolase
MRNKNLLLLFFFLFAFAIAPAQVITSKKEAIKKGVYEKPAEKKSVAVTQTVNPSTTNAVATVAKPVKKAAVAKAKSKKVIINDKNDDDLIIEPEENYLSMQMINNAMGFLGVNYRGGGTSRAGMDCSGMVTAVFDIFGLKLPRSSHEMAKVGAKLKQDEIKKGDLVFFKTNGKSGINHVGIVIEADQDEIKFIHSSTHQGVIISSTKEPYYKRTFAQANRVL